MPLIRLLLVVGVPMWAFEATAQSVQDLMHQALRNPAVRDAMRGRAPDAGRIPNASPVGNPNILEAQRLLNAQGFDAGTPDGIAGAGTRRAIAAFQQSIGRPQTGILTDEEFAILRAPEDPNSGPETAEEQVDAAEVQSLLTELGFDPGPVDGAWGGRSQRALDQFRQRQNSTEIDRPTSVDVVMLRDALSADKPDPVVANGLETDRVKPVLIALPVVDRRAPFSILWENAPNEITVGLVPLWAENITDTISVSEMPATLSAPEVSGLYHVVMIDGSTGAIIARHALEVR